MTSGNIGTWQKKSGDVVAPGDVLVEIETDKAQMDFEFQEDGILAKILKESGSKDVAVGNVGFGRVFRCPRCSRSSLDLDPGGAEAAVYES